MLVKITSSCNYETSHGNYCIDVPIINIIYLLYLPIIYCDIMRILINVQHAFIYKMERF